MLTNKSTLLRFIKGTPVCTRGGMCIHYAAVVVYATGQLIWRHNTYTNSSSMPTKKHILYYAIHSLPMLALVFGIINHWNFQIQFITDLVLLTIISIMDERKDLFR